MKVRLLGDLSQKALAARVQVDKYSSGHGYFAPKRCPKESVGVGLFALWLSDRSLPGGALLQPEP